jgi:transcriptional regulator NrdR family protein
MKCPTCESDTKVLSTRDDIRRRRVCKNGHRFTTMEIPVPDLCDPVSQATRIKEGMSLAKRTRDDRNRQIGTAPGPCDEIAKQFGCSLTHVYRCRRIFAAERLTP